MIEKRVSALLTDINIIERHGGDDPIITGLAYDSRQVHRDNLFFAIDGLHADGHDYISSAVENGARAVVHTKPISAVNHNARPRVTYIRVPDSRRVISPVAARFYDFPSRGLCTFGVTGTDGKSTVVYFIHQLLELRGEPSGFLSTVQYQIADTALKNELRQSTPEANDIQQILSRMSRNGKRYAVLEATSHGLSERNNRLGDVEFNVAVFTNISHEHLEFHGSFEQYRYDKSLLFRRLRAAEEKQKHNKCLDCSVINADDPNSDYFIQASAAPVFTYSLADRNADMHATDIRPGPNGIGFTVHYRNKTTAVSLPLPGVFNVENCLAALLAVSQATGLDTEEFPELVEKLKPVPGRMNLIHEGQPFTVIVDYAHTPGSFSKILPTVKENSRGRLITAFGSAGERDIEKRSIQGELAAEYADIVILTDEDPRGEPPMDILRRIASGCKRCKRATGEQLTEGEDLFLIPDREEAIEKAFSLAGARDTVMLLGKGHEGSIIYNDGPKPWNEAEVARAVLRRRGYGR